MPWRAIRVVLAVLALLAVQAIPAPAEDVAHVIRAGDTPVAVARLYHVPVAAILARNAQLDPCRLKVGDILYVPLDARISTAPKPADSALLPDEEPAGGCYVVAPGDCPATIASRFHVSVEALSRANPGIDTSLPVGRVLAIPVEAGPAAPPPVPVGRPDAPQPSAPLVMDFQ